MSASRALRWDEFTCLVSALAKVSVCWDHPDASFFLSWQGSARGRLKFSYKKSSSGPVGSLLLKPIVLLLLLKLVMSCLWRWVVAHSCSCY